MKRTKQAQLLAVLFDHDLIDSEILVSWADHLIAENDVAESWMIDISLSQERNKDDLVGLLWREFGHEFNWPFTEYIAVVTFLYSSKGLPIDHWVIHLSFAYNYFKISDDDSESVVAAKIVSDLSALLDNNGGYEKAFEQSIVEMENLATKTQEKHKEAIDFIRTYS